MPIFLANAFLFTAAVAVVPVMLHLLHRKRPQPIDFAAIRFLSEAMAKSRRSRRITQCMTLLMRVLIILLLALAFSRPVIKFGGLTLGRQRNLLIVLDSSASMQAKRGDRTLFEDGRDWAAKLIASLDSGDKVALIAPGSPEEQIVYPPVSDHAGVLAALQELRPGFGHADIIAPISGLFSKNTDELRGIEIHVFSDFQRGAWAKTSAKTLADNLSDAGALLFLNHCGAISSGDSGIDVATFVPPAIIDAGSVTARVEISANSQFSGTNVIHIENNGTELNHAAVEPKPGEHISFSMTAETTGGEQQMCGLIRSEDDAYPLNNSFFYSLQRVKGIPVAIVNGTSPRDSFFLRHALNPGGRAVSLLEPFDVDWNTFVATETSTAAMAFVCNPPPLDDAAVSRIETMLAAGKDIVIFPGSAHGITQESLRRIKLLSQIQARLNDNPEASRLEIRQPKANLQFSKRIAAVFPPPWSFPSRCSMEFTMPGGSCENLLETDKGSFLIAAKQDAGTLWLFATSANRDWSDWPVTPSFLVCIQEIARTVAYRPGTALFARVGGDLQFQWPSVSGNSVEMTVTAPDNSTRKVSLTRESQTRPFVLGGFLMPGIHRISDGTRELRFAVNIPTEECVLEYDSRQDVMGTIHGAEAAFSAEHEELLDNISKARQGSPLWPILLCLAFFLSILEVLFANFRSKAAAVPKAVGELLGPLADRTGGRTK